jgi:hypothetical protein
LLIIQSWIANGKQPWTDEPMASYEPYCRIMGGVLAHAGVRGFLGNLDTVRETANPVRDAKQSFITAMWKNRGDEMLPIAPPVGQEQRWVSLVTLAEEAELAVGFTGFDDDKAKAIKLGTFMGMNMKKSTFTIFDSTKGKWIDVRLTSKSGARALWGLTEVERVVEKVNWSAWLQESTYYKLEGATLSL